MVYFMPVAVGELRLDQELQDLEELGVVVMVQ